MKESYTLEQLAEITDCEFIGEADFLVSGVDELQTAKKSDVSFLSNLKYRKLLDKTEAGIICVNRSAPIQEGRNYLLCENPSISFQQIIPLFLCDASRSGFKGIHPTAIIHQSAKIGKSVTIGPYVTIDRDVIVGDHCIIHPHVSIFPEVEIATHCILYSNVVIREKCILGSRVILQPGAVIGGCGYGYITDEGGKHTKIKHFGSVVIEDNVEVGSNSTIDRGRFKETRIAKGTKIDNLVMIAHNVQLGTDNLIVANSGISGSTKTGRNVILGGQVGIVGHVELADGVIMMARSATSKSLLKPGVYGGSPAVSAKEWHKQVIHTRKLSEYVDRVKQIEERLALLEKAESPC